MFLSHYGWMGTRNFYLMRRYRYAFLSHYGWMGTCKGEEPNCDNDSVSKPLRLDGDGHRHRSQLDFVARLLSQYGGMGTQLLRRIHPRKPTVSKPLRLDGDSFYLI